MPPKNKKKNSFYFFMKEMQEREAAKGHNIPIGSMSTYAHPMWVQMSLAEKEPYEEMARKFKNDPCSRGGKLASDGTRVEDNLREIEEEERKENQMIQNIKTYVNINCISEDQFKEFASRKIFYFISFNIMCKTDHEYIPIEVGIVEYSILHGIHREHHKIIHPGRIPTGYTGDAKRLSEEKHQIDIFGENCSERDMVATYNGIKNFVNPEDLDEYPPLFCLEQSIEQTRGCLLWLASRAKRPNEEFLVWNSKYLLLELRAGAGHALPSQIIAEDLLTKSSFNYHPAARCPFHEEKDCHYCALAYSKQLCYLLSDAVCNQFKVVLTEKHIPPQSSEEKGYIVTNFNESSRYNKGRAGPPGIRLDQRSNYYQNEVKEEGQFEDAPSTICAPEPKSNVPRQPASSCIAAEMSRLKLNITEATAPGHGIGRGQRRDN